MKKLILAACAVLLLSAGVDANAADMPWRAPIAKAPPPVAPNWTGLYVGGHLGAGFSTKEWEVTDPNIVLPIHFGSDAVSGFLAGAQIGVNYQVDALVFGIEADASLDLLSELLLGALQIVALLQIPEVGTVSAQLPAMP
jgi:outer membrane immunogenic protein